MKAEKQTTEQGRKQFNLPEDPRPYADKYFLRTGEILRKEGINPWVRAQVMIRKGPGVLAGMNEAVEVIRKYGKLEEVGGKVYALKDGDRYSPRETIMLIEAPIQNIVELETMYLGVPAAETTKATDGKGVDLKEVKEAMAAVRKAAENKPIIYMGARHWRFDEDAAITRAAFEGGATDTSTDAGAATVGKFGVGTTPHVLENIMAWKYGYSQAVVETMLAYNRVMPAGVPRIILVDYRNKEITDALATARALEGRLDGIRIDTCGENVGEGAIENVDYDALERLAGRRVDVPKEDEKYWFGRGVTVSGVLAASKALEENGFGNIKVVLSSGFANPKKTGAFVKAEKILGRKLFDVLGVGQVFESRTTKMDIVAVGDTPETMIPISKAGRGYNPNPRLELVLGGAA
jgi:nicotinate phosphoribosyltransferase